MANRWDATIHIDTALAEKVIKRQFLELNLKHIIFLGEGWDNTVFLVNDKTVFRFPRREFGLGCLKDEISLMPRVAKQMSTPISYPIYVGEPTDDFPHIFAGYHFLPGTPISEIDFNDLPRTNLLKQLAHALKALHAIDTSAFAADIPADICHRMDYDNRKPRVSADLDALEKSNHLSKQQKHTCLDIMEALASAFPVKATAIVHGDLYSRHLLMQDKNLSGIIDWGDVHYNTPAIDLSAIYSLFPIQHHQDFWDIYDEVDKPIKMQALFRALYSNILLNRYAIDVNDPVLLKAGMQGLENVCAAADVIEQG